MISSIEFDNLFLFVNALAIRRANITASAPEAVNLTLSAQEMTSVIFFPSKIAGSFTILINCVASSACFLIALMIAGWL